MVVAVALRRQEIRVLDAGDEGQVIRDGEPVDVGQGAIEGKDEAGGPLVAHAIEDLDVGGG